MRRSLHPWGVGEGFLGLHQPLSTVNRSRRLRTRLLLESASTREGLRNKDLV